MYKQQHRSSDYVIDQDEIDVLPFLLREIDEGRDITITITKPKTKHKPKLLNTTPKISTKKAKKKPILIKPNINNNIMVGTQSHSSKPNSKKKRIIKCSSCGENHNCRSKVCFVNLFASLNTE